jgi:hypothetical protein
MRTKAVREADRLRQQAKRARDKAARNPDGDSTPRAFWKRNREVGNQTQIAGLLERQEYILDLVQVIAETIAGDVDLDQPFADLVAAHVTAHGTCETEVILLEFWRDQEMLAELALNEPTKNFARYGLITAMPSQRLYEFQTWVQSRKPANPQPLNLYTSLQCACGSLPSAVSQAIADGYREKNILYRCHECIRKERSSNAAVGKALAAEYKQPESTIFDSWGRIKL